MRRRKLVAASVIGLLFLAATAILALSAGFGPAGVATVLAITAAMVAATIFLGLRVG